MHGEKTKELTSTPPFLLPGIASNKDVVAWEENPIRTDDVGARFRVGRHFAPLQGSQPMQRKPRVSKALLALLPATGALGWSLDHAYPIPELPSLAAAGTRDTVWAFAAEKSGTPKTYPRSGIPLRLSGFGALTRDPSDPTGATFWALDDRGLATAFQTTSLEGKIIALPGYHQKLVRFHLQGDALQVVSIDSIGSWESPTLFTTGRPSTKAGKAEPAFQGRLDSAVLDLTAAITPVAHGYDFESLKFLPSGDLVASDELGPTLVQIARSNLRISREWYPGKGLPKVFANRRENRGFEAVAATPSGKMVAILQSPSHTPNSDTKNSRAIRLVWLDPATGAVREHVYLSDLKNGRRLGGEVKIGDLVAVSESRFLAIEHGVDDGGKYWIDLVEFDLATATDVHDVGDAKDGKTWGGKTLEQIGLDPSDAVWTSAGIAPVTRSVRWADLLSTQSVWTSTKPEGMDLLGDSGLVLLNDNGYGAEDKNGDGIPHLASESERSQSLTVLRIPPASSVVPRTLLPELRTWREGQVLRVEGAGTGEVVLLDLAGRPWGRAKLRSGSARLSLQEIPDGAWLLATSGGSRVVRILR